MGKFVYLFVRVIYGRVCVFTRTYYTNKKVRMENFKKYSVSQWLVKVRICYCKR